MDAIYIVVWSGGYEPVSISAHATEAGARLVEGEWKEDSSDEPGDMIDVYKINLATLAVEAM